ncbi:MAG TPA: hypothetical protein PKX92_00930 [Edaphocola sp.]|nr:hypothetical protein [Edaphocola sp.]
MKALLILLAIFIFIIVMIVFTTKKKNKNMELKNRYNTISNKLSAYQLYLNWCKNKNLIPVSEVKFNSLANEKGSVNIAAMIALHPEYQIANKTSDNYETKKLKENKEQKKENQDFVNSAVIGYMTDSTTTGTLLGRSLLGGMLGSHLSKKKMK